MYSLWYAYFLYKNSNLKIGDIPFLRKAADKLSGTTSSISTPPKAVQPPPSAPVRTPSTPKDIPGRSPPVQPLVPSLPPVKRAQPPNRFLPGYGQSIGAHLNSCISAIIRRNAVEQQAAIEAFVRTAGLLESDREKQDLEERVRADLANKDRELAAALDQCLKEAGKEAEELAVKHAREAFEKVTKKFNDEMAAASAKVAAEKAAAMEAPALSSRIREVAEKTAMDEFAALEECMKSAGSMLSHENQALMKCLESAAARKAAADASAMSALLEDARKKISAEEENARKALLQDLLEKEKAEAAAVEQCVKEATAKKVAEETIRVEQLYTQKAEETLVVANAEVDMCLKKFSDVGSAEMRENLEACIKRAAKKKADTDAATMETLVKEAARRIQDEEMAAIYMCTQRAMQKLKGDDSGGPHDQYRDKESIGTTIKSEKKSITEPIPERGMLQSGPREEESEKQPGIRPGEEDSKSKSQLGPGTEDSGKQSGLRPGEDDSKSKSQLGPGEEDSGKQSGLRPGEDDSKGKSQLGPGEEDSEKQSGLRPGEDDSKSKSQLGPGEEDSGKQSGLRPGEDDSKSKSQLGPGEEDSGKQSGLRPGEDDSKSKSQLGPGEEDSGEKSGLGPGEDDSKSKSQLGPGEEDSRKLSGLRPGEDGSKSRSQLGPGEDSSETSGLRLGEDDSRKRSVLHPGEDGSRRSQLCIREEDSNKLSGLRPEEDGSKRSQLGHGEDSRKMSGLRPGEDGTKRSQLGPGEKFSRKMSGLRTGDGSRRSQLYLGEEDSRKLSGLRPGEDGSRSRSQLGPGEEDSRKQPGLRPEEDVFENECLGRGTIDDLRRKSGLSFGKEVFRQKPRPSSGVESAKGESVGFHGDKSERSTGLPARSASDYRSRAMAASDIKKEDKALGGLVTETDDRSKVGSTDGDKIERIKPIKRESGSLSRMDESTGKGGFITGDEEYNDGEYDECSEVFQALVATLGVEKCADVTAPVTPKTGYESDGSSRTGHWRNGECVCDPPGKPKNYEAFRSPVSFRASKENSDSIASRERNENDRSLARVSTTRKPSRPSVTVPINHDPEHGKGSVGPGRDDVRESSHQDSSRAKLSPSSSIHVVKKEAGTSEKMNLQVTKVRATVSQCIQASRDESLEKIITPKETCSEEVQTSEKSAVNDEAAQVRNAAQSTEVQAETGVEHTELSPSRDCCPYQNASNEQRFVCVPIDQFQVMSIPSDQGGPGPSNVEKQSLSEAQIATTSYVDSKLSQPVSTLEESEEESEMPPEKAAISEAIARVTKLRELQKNSQSPAEREKLEKKATELEMLVAELAAPNERGSYKKPDFGILEEMDKASELRAASKIASSQSEKSRLAKEAAGIERLVAESIAICEAKSEAARLRQAASTVTSRAEKRCLERAAAEREALATKLEHCVSARRDLEARKLMNEVVALREAARVTSSGAERARFEREAAEREKLIPESTSVRRAQLEARRLREAVKWAQCPEERCCLERAAEEREAFVNNFCGRSGPPSKTPSGRDIRERPSGIIRSGSRRPSSRKDSHGPKRNIRPLSASSLADSNRKEHLAKRLDPKSFSSTYEAVIGQLGSEENVRKKRPDLPKRTSRAGSTVSDVYPKADKSLFSPRTETSRRPQSEPLTCQRRDKTKHNRLEQPDSRKTLARNFSEEVYPANEIPPYVTKTQSHTLADWVNQECTILTMRQVKKDDLKLEESDQHIIETNSKEFVADSDRLASFSSARSFLSRISDGKSECDHPDTKSESKKEPKNIDPLLEKTESGVEKSILCIKDSSKKSSELKASNRSSIKTSNHASVDASECASTKDSGSCRTTSLVSGDIVHSSDTICIEQTYDNRCDKRKNASDVISASRPGASKDNKQKFVETETNPRSFPLNEGKFPGNQKQYDGGSTDSGRTTANFETLRSIVQECYSRKYPRNDRGGAVYKKKYMDGQNSRPLHDSGTHLHDKDLHVAPFGNTDTAAESEELMSVAITEPVDRRPETERGSRYCSKESVESSFTEASVSRHNLRALSVSENLSIDATPTEKSKFHKLPTRESRQRNLEGLKGVKPRTRTSTVASISKSGNNEASGRMKETPTMKSLSVRQSYSAEIFNVEECSTKFPQSSKSEHDIIVEDVILAVELTARYAAGAAAARDQAFEAAGFAVKAVAFEDLKGARRAVEMAHTAAETAAKEAFCAARESAKAASCATFSKCSRRAAALATASALAAQQDSVTAGRFFNNAADALRCLEVTDLSSAEERLAAATFKKVITSSICSADAAAKAKTHMAAAASAAESVENAVVDASSKTDEDISTQEQAAIAAAAEAAEAAAQANQEAQSAVRASIEASKIASLYASRSSFVASAARHSSSSAADAKVQAAAASEAASAASSYAQQAQDAAAVLMSSTVSKTAKRAASSAALVAAAKTAAARSASECSQARSVASGAAAQVTSCVPVNRLCLSSHDVKKLEDFALAKTAEAEAAASTAVKKAESAASYAAKAKAVSMEVLELVGQDEAAAVAGRYASAAAKEAARLANIAAEDAQAAHNEVLVCRTAAANVCLNVPQQQSFESVVQIKSPSPLSAPSERRSVFHRSDTSKTRRVPRRPANPDA